MKIIDQYLLRQFVESTLGILLLFSCIVLLVQSIRIVDVVAHYGAGVSLFFEMALYMMPRVLRIALPISVFLAVVHVIHRLHSDSELFAVFTAGSGAHDLLRPVLAFASGVAIVSALVTMLFAPWAAGEALDRRAQLGAEIEPRLMQDGQFLTPRPGLTAFVREIGRDKSLQDLFLYDRHRENGHVTVYTARRGWLQTDSEAATLTLQKGVALEFDRDWSLVSRFTFDQFMQNLVEFDAAASSRKPVPNEMYLGELLSYRADPQNPEERARIRTEIHEQLSAPLYAFALPVLALASLLAGFNQARIPLSRIAVSFALGVALVLSAFSTRNVVAGSPDSAWVMYAPPVFAVLASVLLLLKTQRRMRRGRVAVS